MTNPTMSAEERAQEIYRHIRAPRVRTMHDLCLEQIRQAEQAAHQQGKEEGRREALEKAVQIAEKHRDLVNYSTHLAIAANIRALAEKETV